MASSSKAIIVKGFENGAPVLELIERPVPTPGPGQVLVRITHRPVNPADLFSLQGVYPGFQPTFGSSSSDSSVQGEAVPGLDGVGKVEAVGEGVSEFKVGARVVGVPFPSIVGNGTWQQHLVVDASTLYALPESLNIDDFNAAQFWVNPVTAYGLLTETSDELGLTNGPDSSGWIISAGASSALGYQIVRLAKKKGIKTINIIRSAKYVDSLKEAGADVVLIQGVDDIAAGIAEATGGKGADAAFEPRGGDVADIPQSVRTGGKVFLYGAMASVQATINVPDLLFRYVELRGWWLVRWASAKTPADQKVLFDNVAALIADGTLGVQVGETFPLEQYDEAIKASAAAGRNEKVFLVG